MKLSLCIIAKNEERMLPDCLASVRDVVDEIVLVDTGSRDATIRIAERAGARVFKSPWRDDFSAPRNLAIARARGEWILQLDADERLAPGAGEQIKRALSGADFDCGLIRLHNASRADAPAAEVISGRARMGEAMSLPRLLRRTTDLRYEGIVHESVLRWLEGRGGRVRFVDADIVHLGSLPELRRERDKVTRNVDLLKKRASEEPNDPTAWSYIAFESLAADQLDDAWSAAEAGWQVMLRGQYPKGTSVLRLAVARALVQKGRGEHHAVLETVRVGERLDGKHPDFYMLRGTAHELLALAAGRGSKLRLTHLRAALEAHRSALALARTDYVQRFLLGAGSWASALRGGTVLLQLGDAEGARAVLAEALAARPDELETKLAMAEAEIACGRPEDAILRIEPLLSDRPDAWVLAAQACEKLGAVDDGLAFIRQAGQRTKAGYVAPHRREMHLDLMALASAYAGAPAPGPGPIGALTAIMSKRPFEGDARGDVDALGIASIVSNLVTKQRYAYLDALLTPRAEATFPGLGAGVTRALERLGLSVQRDDSPSPIVVACDDTRAAELVQRVLGAHPRIASRGELERSEVAKPGDEEREIFTAPSFARALELGAALPRSTVLLVTSDPPSAETLADVANAVGDRAVELSYGALLDAPVTTLSHLLAALGEPTDDGPLRALVESYPGRSRDFPAFAPRDREKRASRLEGDAARALPREVSP